MDPPEHPSNSAYSWGWHYSTLKIALICSKLDHASSGWQPWLSATNLFCLDNLQNHALQVATGQLVSTPLDALHLEAVIQSYNTCTSCLVLRAWEKVLRSTVDHTKRIVLAANLPHCLPNCSSFHRKANDLSTLLSFQLKHHQIINNFPSLPWQCSTLHKEHISIFIPCIAGQADDTTSKHKYSLIHIASYQADYIIYTNGSASERTRNGDTADVITRGQLSKLKA